MPLKFKGAANARPSKGLQAKTKRIVSASGDTCPECHGTGKINGHPCEKCHGTGHITHH